MNSMLVLRPPDDEVMLHMLSPLLLVIGLCFSSLTLMLHVQALHLFQGDHMSIRSPLSTIHKTLESTVVNIDENKNTQKLHFNNFRRKYNYILISFLHHKLP